MTVLSFDGIAEVIVLIRRCLFCSKDKRTSKKVRVDCIDWQLGFADQFRRLELQKPNVRSLRLFTAGLLLPQRLLNQTWRSERAISSAVCGFGRTVISV
jgi:hypothetical protein